MSEEILSQETTLERITRWNMQGLHINFHSDGNITCWENENPYPLFSGETFEEFAKRVEAYLQL